MLRWWRPSQSPLAGQCGGEWASHLSELALHRHQPMPQLRTQTRKRGDKSGGNEWGEWRGAGRYGRRGGRGWSAKRRRSCCGLTLLLTSFSSYTHSPHPQRRRRQQQRSRCGGAR